MLLLLELRSELRGSEAIVDLAPHSGRHLVLVAVDVGVLVVDVVSAGCIFNASLGSVSAALGMLGIALAVLGLELLLDGKLVAEERIVDAAPDISSVFVVVAVLVGVLVVDGGTLAVITATSFDTGNKGQSSNNGDLKMYRVIVELLLKIM